MKAGVADCIILHDSRSYAIELKRPKGPNGEPPGYLSPVQKDWRDDFIAAGGTFRLCRSTEEVTSVLNEWGIVDE